MDPPDKKSSIPRPVHEHDRSAKSKSKAQKLQSKSTNPTPRPAPCNGLIPEDENAVRRSVQQLETDHARMKASVEETIRDAEERLEAMQKLMDERERRHADEMKSATDKAEQLQLDVQKYENKLLEKNIDPVTMENLELSEEEAEAVKKQRKVSQADVQRMRERLHDINMKSDIYLKDMQQIKKELEELEAVSSRAGGLTDKDIPEDISAFFASGSTDASMQKTSEAAEPAPAVLPSESQSPEPVPGLDLTSKFFLTHS